MSIFRSRIRIATIFLTIGFATECVQAQQGIDVKGTLVGYDLKQGAIRVLTNGEEQVFPIFRNAHVEVRARGTKDFLKVDSWAEINGRWEPETNRFTAGRITIHLVPKYTLMFGARDHLSEPKQIKKLGIEVAGQLIDVDPVRLKSVGKHTYQWIIKNKLAVKNGNVSLVTGAGDRTPKVNFRGKTLQFDSNPSRSVWLNLGPHLEYAGTAARIRVYIPNKTTQLITVDRVGPPLKPSDVSLGQKTSKRK